MAKTIPSPCTPKNISERCESLGFALSDAPLAALSSYLTLLVKWNKVMNLVGPADWENILSSLVIDSLYLADFIQTLPLPEHPECRDLGAGAGLPGLPLRMIWQKGTYVLVEAREKRALFLRSCLAATPLPGVLVCHGRAETFMASAPHAHLTVSRAFLPWERVLALVAPYTDKGSFCLFLTLNPLPSSLPEQWQPFGEKRYTIHGTDRYFWALQKAVSL
jgi:16S rRNA (guanine527-N7)-methyltransferase